MDITYGHQVTSNDDKFIGIAQRAGEETVTAGRLVTAVYARKDKSVNTIHSVLAQCSSISSPFVGCSIHLYGVEVADYRHSETHPFLVPGRWFQTKGCCSG